MVLAAFVSASGQPIFTKITTGDIVNDVGNYTTCAWGDFNNDGYLDLFVSSWNNTTNVFYRNNGNGTFTKITSGDPVADRTYHTGSAWADFDNDGNLDLLVVDGGGVPSPGKISLYRNNGDSTFTRMTNSTPPIEKVYFVGGSWADYDNDGWLDFFVTQNIDYSTGRSNLLYHNNGDGTFTKITSGQIVTDLGVGFGCSWGDYDNDGLLDLLVVNRTPTAMNFLYHNLGKGAFERVTTGPIASHIGYSGAAAWGDFNNDGMPDLLVRQVGGGSVMLYENQFPRAHWLKVSLHGVRSNSLGIGSRLVAELNGHRIVRDLYPANTFASQAPSYVHFGLGEFTEVERLSIHWPSGTQQVLLHLAADQHIEVTEGEAETRRLVGR